MDVPADVRCVQVKKNAQDVHGEVLAQIEQRDQQPLSQIQLKGVARTDAPDPSGAQQRAAVGALQSGSKSISSWSNAVGLSPTSRSKERARDFSFFNRNTLEPTRFRLYCATGLENTVSGCVELLQWAASHGFAPPDLQVATEATGVYWETCALTLHQAGCQVSVINPAQIKLFARSVLRRGKTDTMDVEIIARYGVVMQPSVWEPPPASIEELKVLVRERETLLHTLTQERNRLHALQHKARSITTVVALVQQRIDLLFEQINALEHSMHALVAMNPTLSEALKMFFDRSWVRFCDRGECAGRDPGLSRPTFQPSTFCVRGYCSDPKSIRGDVWENANLKNRE